MSFVEHNPFPKFMIRNGSLFYRSGTVPVDRLEYIGLEYNRKEKKTSRIKMSGVRRLKKSFSKWNDLFLIEKCGASSTLQVS